MLIIAGSKIREYNHAAPIPMAVILPKCQKGGESEKFNDRKPITVVKDVMVTGKKLIRMESTIASVLLMPSSMA